MHRLLIPISLVCTSCASVGATVDVPVPVECARASDDVDELIVAAVSVLADADGEEQIRDGLADLAKTYGENTDQIRCAVEVFVWQRGDDLTAKEKLAVKIVRRWLAERDE